MKGYRCKIGLLVPANNTVAEPTFYQYAPEGVTIHAGRMPRDNRISTIETHINMLEYVVSTAESIAQCEPDVLILADTTASFLQGKGVDIKLAENMKEATSIKSTTASTVVCEALKVLNCKRLSIITPYPGFTNEKEIAFFEDNGFKIDVLKGMEIIESIAMGNVHPSEIYRFARDNYNRNSDAIFISCTNYRGTEIINILEDDTGLPVVTSNQACIWWALRTVGMKTDIGLGKLFQV